MRISQKNEQKILEQIIWYLFINSSKPLFTSHIASQIVRDEEYTKKLLLKLKRKKIIKEVNKNPLGKIYLKRKRWVLSDKTYVVYNKFQKMRAP